jgi:hypothetical protein
LGRIKRPVPNVRGGGAAVPSGLFDSPGGDLSGPQQVPFNDPNANYANYGMPNPTLQQVLQQMPPQVPQQMARGGVVTKPTVAVVGEREPEAVVKLRPRMSYQRRE